MKLSIEVSIPSNCGNQSTVPANFQDSVKLNVKIRCTLKHALSGYSDNSVTDTVESFRLMFPGGKIPILMELGKRKLMYIDNYGIAPFFRIFLKDEIAHSFCYCVPFDESLNKVVQGSEMDLLIRN